MLELLMGAKNKYSHLDNKKEDNSVEAAQTSEEGVSHAAIDRLKQDVDFAERFRNSDFYANDVKKIEELTSTKGAKLISDIRYGAKFFMQCAENTKRWWQLVLRDNGLNLTRILVILFMALLGGGVAFQVKPEGERGLQNWLSRNGILFGAGFFTALVQGIMVIPVLANSKAAYYRERSSLTYSTSSFLIGNFEK